MKMLEKWSAISLINLAIVASLGLLLRCKMIFSIPAVDFKNVLHAHSHFAFGGWVSLALMSLMVYGILPAQVSSRKVYKHLLAGILICAFGMLFSFPFQGYSFVSILFSTLFIFVSYGFSFVFIKDIVAASVTRSVKVLSIGSVVYMAASSVGAFTLAYLMATKSGDFVLFKDAVYTYLHLQYNGFFTLAVFAIMFNYLKDSNKHVTRFSLLLTLSVIPSMFMSYLWHYPNIVVWLFAMAGTVLIVISALSFLPAIRSLKPKFKQLTSPARITGAIAMTAFFLKLIFQSLTIVPSLGPLVFANRPVIIGFLHLVLLGFVSLYIIAHYFQTGLLPARRIAKAAVGVLVTGIILNELILFIQGLGFMLMMSSSLTNWLLLVAALLLFTGTLLLALCKCLNHPMGIFSRYSFKNNSSSNFKIQ